MDQKTTVSTDEIISLNVRNRLLLDNSYKSSDGRPSAGAFLICDNYIWNNRGNILVKKV